MPTGIYKRTKNHSRNISKALKGKTPKNFAECLKKAHLSPKKKGKDNPGWKGDDVGYSGLHQWVRRELGEPNKCEKCETTKAKKYEWANISLKYKRDLNDWKRLCVSCHRKEGYESGEYKSWNKGKHIQTNTGRTHIKKGQRLSKSTEFKKGMIPHNKYLESKCCSSCGKEFQPREAKQKYCKKRCYWDSLKL